MADLNHIAPLFYQDRAKSRKMLPPYTYICQSKSFTDKSIFFCAIPILFLSPFLFSALFSFFLPSSSPSNQPPPPLCPSFWRFFHPPLHFFAKINFSTSRQHKNFFSSPMFSCKRGNLPSHIKSKSHLGGECGVKNKHKSPPPNPDLPPGPSPMGRGEHAS